MDFPNLWKMLLVAAESKPERGVTFVKKDDQYPSGREVFISYQSIYRQAHMRSVKISSCLGYVRPRVEEEKMNMKEWKLKQHRVVLLHVEDPIESIIWFWACIASGAIPCLSTPFKDHPSDRKTYMDGLKNVLHTPLMITTEDIFHLFDRVALSGFRIQTTEKLLEDIPDKVCTYDDRYVEDQAFSGHGKVAGDIAVLMLTSGSTGAPKAVPLTQGQIMKSLEGKTKKHRTSKKDVFLNWTDFSHVANLMEIHLHAIYHNAHQIHMPSQDVVTDSLHLLDSISKYRVSYTFAPNFALADILENLKLPESSNINGQHTPGTLPTIVEEDVPEIPKRKFKIKTPRVSFRKGFTGLKKFLKHPIHSPRKQFPTATVVKEVYTGPKDEFMLKYQTDHFYDLSCLRNLISGGESNVVQTCVDLTRVLKHYDAPKSFIRPGFGMTETCAGCIYSIDCPGIDVAGKSEFATLGSPIANTLMRVVNGAGEVEYYHGVGNLQLSGPTVFKGYYNDDKATAESIKDGWFETGDLARIDLNGHLHLVGRSKDTLVINGVNHYAHTIEAVLNEKTPGLKPAYTAVFPHRPDGSSTEAMCVVFCPTYDQDDFAARDKTLKVISKKVIGYSGVRPYRIIPLPPSMLEKSTLGKLSRTKIRKNFEEKLYDAYIQASLVKAPKTEIQQRVTGPRTMTETVILEEYQKLFNDTSLEICVDSDVSELGVSSIDLLKLRVGIQKSLKIEFPITLFFKNSTIEKLAAAIDDLNNAAYDPIVVLQPNGKKTPVFFIHPGMGEVLIFMNIARLITDRPVYALRARGFDGEKYFGSMEEMIREYHDAIKRVQPEGPYALCGYSFGSILTFEITKRMLANGDEVRFLGTLDQPPHFKNRAQTYDWYECVLSVAFFLGLMDEKLAYASMDEMRKKTHAQVIDHIIKFAPPARLLELGMNAERLNNWAKLAFSMKKISWNYDPSGRVPHMDIFYTVPLLGIVAAKSTDEWREDFIGKWDNFVEKPIYRFMAGGHRTLINPPHVANFHVEFANALKRRGV